jgi:hypothetical protein
LIGVRRGVQIALAMFPRAFPSDLGGSHTLVSDAAEQAAVSDQNQGTASGLHIGDGRRRDLDRRSAASHPFGEQSRVSLPKCLPLTQLEVSEPMRAAGPGIGSGLDRHEPVKGA